MIKEIRFIVLYFGCFIGISMIAIRMYDDHPNEMLGFALWGGIAYAAAGFIPWIIINRLSLSIDDNKLRYVIRFVSGLAVMYLLIFLTNRNLNMDTGILIAINVIYILSFVIASIGYTSGNQNLQSDQEATP